MEVVLVSFYSDMSSLRLLVEFVVMDVETVLVVVSGVMAIILVIVMVLFLCSWLS